MKYRKEFTMKVDYHVHLEEGPYSINWWQRTLKAIDHFQGSEREKHTRNWLEDVTKTMQKRLEAGPFSSNWLDLYLKKAKELGIKEVGIVDHLYRFIEMKPYYEKYMDLESETLGPIQQKWLNHVSTERLDNFITFIESEKEKWEAEGVKLKLGIEADFFPGCEKELQELLSPYEWDHVIGSIHFYNGWGFDNPETKEYFEQFDLLSLYENHFRVVEQAISSKLFDIVAHLDNLKVFSYRPDETLLLNYYHQIAKSLKKHQVATEVNTGLAYRYPIKEMCPSPSFLHILAEYGVDITTSSDSHFPDDLGTMLEEARDRLKKAGFQRIVTFDKRLKRHVPLT